MRKLILMMFLFGVSSIAHATWEKFEMDGNGDTSYLDKSSIRRYGDKVKVYVLVDARQIETVGNDKYRSIKSELELDCTRSLVRVAYLSMYTDKMASGIIIKFGALDRELEPIEEGSPSATLLSLVCTTRQ
ncbi:MAG: hypothetical protein IPP88_02975 [Betaproteobacteria bacterium]|nr:hypothetical protein [Betaproteobacteria bacterium]